MRWPIRLQLLLSTLVVVLLAVFLVSATSVYLVRSSVQRQQRQSLDRMVRTTAALGFPLNDWVLRQMSGLSGAEFVYLSGQGDVRGTLRPGDDELARLVELPLGDASDDAAPQRVELGGRAYLARRIAVSPRATPGPGWLLVLYPEERWWAEARQAVYPALVAGGAAALAAIFASALLAARLVRRIRRLVEQTARIAGGDFEPLALAPGNDEIGELSASVNRMAGQLRRYEDQVRQTERVQTLGRLAAGIAHHLRNAATGARMAAELHQLSCTADAESLEVVLRQLRLMEAYLRRFLDQRQPPLRPRPMDLAGLVRETLDLVRPAAAHAKIALDLQTPPPAAMIEGDEEALRQVVVNLALNAIEATARQEESQRRVSVVVEDRGARVVLSVADSGRGPTPEVASRLFEPFASDKPGGTGLGLFVARQIVEAHGGSIRCQQPAGATQFVVEFPRFESPPSHGPPADR